MKKNLITFKDKLTGEEITPKSKHLYRIALVPRYLKQIISFTFINFILLLS